MKLLIFWLDAALVENRSTFAAMLRLRGQCDKNTQIWAKCLMSRMLLSIWIGLYPAGRFYTFIIQQSCIFENANWYVHAADRNMNESETESDGFFLGYTYFVILTW